MIRKALIIAGVALCAGSLGGCYTTAEGEKVGTIVKFAQEGAFSVTWEGELIRGGLTAGTGAQGRPFDFTVEDPKLVPILRDAMEKNKEVKIFYHREMFAAPWRTETKENYFVDRVEVTGKPGEAPQANGLAPTPPLDIQKVVDGASKEQIDGIAESLKSIDASLKTIAQGLAPKP